MQNVVVIVLRCLVWELQVNKVLSYRPSWNRWKRRVRCDHQEGLKHAVFLHWADHISTALVAIYIYILSVEDMFFLSVPAFSPFNDAWIQTDPIYSSRLIEWVLLSCPKQSVSERHEDETVYLSLIVFKVAEVKWEEGLSAASARRRRRNQSKRGPLAQFSKTSPP